MTGIHRNGGGGGGCHGPGGGGGDRRLGFDRRGSSGGSGKFKAKSGGGGSGQFPAVTGNPGHGGVPPGQLKKMQEAWAQNSWDNGGLLSNIFGRNNNNQGGILGILGSLFSSNPTQVVNGQKPGPGAPVDISGAPQSGKAQDLPFISQYNPAGKDANYVNADANCGPALLASMAKARGQTGGLTDAQLINKLGTVAGTTAEGTSGNGMIDALQSLGMQTAAAPGADMNWINSQLAQGHDVFANGDFYSIPTHADPNLQAGHYIAVTGVNNGVYTVVDPADSSVHNLTAQQLQNFIAAHPEGGFAIGAW